MPETDSKKLKENRTMLLILIWVGVIVIAVAAFVIFGTGSANPGSQAESPIIINLVYQTETIEPAECDFIEFTNEDTMDDIIAVTGVDPTLYGLPEGYEISGAGKYLPHGEDGELSEDDAVVNLYIKKTDDDSRYIMCYVSKSGRMLVENKLNAYNRDLTVADEKWSTIGEKRFKLYKVRYPELDTANYLVIFLHKGHFWHIEFHNQTISEITAAVNEVFSRN